MRSLLGAALTYRSRSGKTAGERIGDVWISGEPGREWVRWCARKVYDLGHRPHDAARRGAARALLELFEPPDAETLAQRDLDDELLTIAAVWAQSAGDE